MSRIDALLRIEFVQAVNRPAHHLGMKAIAYATAASCPTPEWTPEREQHARAAFADLCAAGWLLALVLRAWHPLFDFDDCVRWAASCDDPQDLSELTRLAAAAMPFAGAEVSLDDERAIRDAAAELCVRKAILQPL